MSKDKLYKLSESLDNINYEHDTYNYMDNIDNNTDTIDEARKKEVDKIYQDLSKGNTLDYINYILGMLDEDITEKQAQEAREVFKQLQILKNEYKELNK